VKPMPLRERVPMVLRLAPMTNREAAHVLSSHPHSVARVLWDLREEGCVRIQGSRRSRGGRPYRVWRLA
jgi:predicted ArsR family transcriptional regulator